MRQAVTVSLSPPLRQSLDAICAQDGLTRSDVVQRVLRQWVIGRELELARREVMPYAEAAGLLTDDDVYLAVS